MARFSGAALRAARERHGLTRQEIAAALGVAATHRIRIWGDEAEQPRPAMIPRLAALLDLPPVTLLSGVSDPPCPSALRLAAALSRSDVVAASATLTTMTYGRLDTRAGARRSPPTSVLEELASILQVPPAAVAVTIGWAREIATASRGTA